MKRAYLKVVSSLNSTPNSYSPKHQTNTNASKAIVTLLGKLKLLIKSRGMNMNTCIKNVPVTSKRIIKINGGIKT